MSSQELVLDDYLMKLRARWTPQKWNTANTSLRRALKSGGSLHDLVKDGSIKATEDAKIRGRADSWVHQAKVGEPKLEKDIQTDGSRALTASALRIDGRVSEESQGHLREIAHISATRITEGRWAVIAEHVEGIAEREAIARLEAEHKDQLIARDRQLIQQQQAHIANLQENTRQMLTLLDRLTGGEGNDGAVIPSPSQEN
ncbi:hypothetical protein ACHMW5_11780 [Azospirillum melinis]|uniref:hypothetical protein n=1 Tax=Azospirillum melinis TaxID=328839 RepID=UPI0037583C62